MKSGFSLMWKQKTFKNGTSRLKIIKRLRSLRKKPGIKVRLLMTTGCVEYWFMLHYKMFAPPIQTVAEKERIIAELIEQVPDYQKGDLPLYFKNCAELSRQQSKMLKGRFPICFKTGFRA